MRVNGTIDFAARSTTTIEGGVGGVKGTAAGKAFTLVVAP